MLDEASTAPADSPPQQAPPPQEATDGHGTDGQSTQSPPTNSAISPQGEPVSAPAVEPTLPPQESAPVTEQEEPENSAPTEAHASISESAPEPKYEPPQTDFKMQQTTPDLADSGTPFVKGDIAKARAKIQETKHKKLDKIMAALDGKGPTTLKLRGVNKITNDEVEKLLRVSDATATRYLQTLEKEGKIQQVGVTGKAVWYEKSGYA